MTGNINLAIPSPYLSDYSAPDNSDLKITLLNTDINNPSIDVYLRIRIEGSGISVVTKPNITFSPTTLTSGLPTVLMGADLLPYLSTENLIFQGYSASAYRQRAALPDGFYSICVEAYNLQTNYLVSQGICTQALLTSLEPPLLNTPAPCGLKLTPTDPLNIVFTWTPMHSTPASIEYVFELFWVPAGRNPNDIALNTSSLWFTTTTFATAYQYGFSDLPLTVGETYAWRIQARDVSGRSLFLREGKSAVCYFVYGEKCIPPTNVEAAVEGAQRVIISWENEIATTASIVEYREYDGTDPKWYRAESTTNKLTLTAVKPNTKYEYRVLNRCGAETSSGTAIDTFRTKVLFTNNKLSCNQNPNLPPVDSTSKLSTLQVGDKVKVGDFVITIVSASGNNGRFSGTCTVPVNLLNTNVFGTFTDLYINDRYEAYRGEVLLNSATVSYLPPAVKTKVQVHINNINTYIDNVDGGLGSVQNGINTATGVVTQINTFIDENPNLPDEIKSNLIDIKNAAQSGVIAMTTGDTTTGKSILGGIQEWMGEVLNSNSGHTNGFRDWLLNFLNEKKVSQRDSIENTKLRYRELLAENKRLANELNKEDRVLGDFDAISFNSIESSETFVEIPITPDQERILMQDPTFRAYVENSKEIDNRERILLQGLTYIFVVKNLLDNSHLINQLKNDLQKKLLADLAKIGATSVDEVLNGKNPEIEAKAKEFVNQKIDEYVLNWK